MYAEYLGGLLQDLSDELMEEKRILAIVTTLMVVVITERAIQAGEAGYGSRLSPHIKSSYELN